MIKRRENMGFEIKIDDKLCSGCGNCVIVCPVNALKSVEISGGVGPREEQGMAVTSGTAFVYDPEFCRGCGSCLKACTFDAIQIETAKIEPLSKQQKIGDIMYGEKSKVYEALKNGGPLSLEQLAEKLDIPTKEVSVHLFSLKSDGKVFEYEKIDGRYTYSTKPPVAKSKEDAEESVKPAVDTKTVQKMREKIEDMITSMKGIKIRFLIETDKIDKAKEELGKVKGSPKK